MSKIFHTLTGISCACAASLSIAGPWADAGDARLRHSLEVLSDSQLVSFPINEWPLMWGDIAYHIDGLNEQPLTALQSQALKYIQFELDYQTSDKVRSQFHLDLSTDRQPFQGFSQYALEKGAVGTSNDWMGEDFAYKVNLTRVRLPEDKHSYRLDRSYVGYVLGDWALSVNTLDRWWGGGWDSSLLLGNSSRPVPAFAIQRKVAKPFAMSGLKLLGPWRVSGFLGKLEQNRIISGANVTGVRFSASPSKRFELGLTRVVQWGGSAKDSSLSGLIDAFSGQSQDGESGVQLNGIDFRYSISLADKPGALYGQWVNAASSQAKQLYLAGMELAGINFWKTPSQAQWNSRLWIEFSSLSAGEVSDKNSGGAAYGNDIYQSGYHYFGRSLGSGYDSGSSALVTGAQFFFDNGDDFSVTLRRVQLNTDAVSASFFGAKQSVTGVQLGYSHHIANHRVKLGLTFNNKTIQTGVAELDRFALMLKHEYRF